MFWVLPGWIWLRSSEIVVLQAQRITCGLITPAFPEFDARKFQEYKGNVAGRNSDRVDQASYLFALYSA
jgi:hypothetical protein